MSLRFVRSAQHPFKHVWGVDRSASENRDAERARFSWSFKEKLIASTWTNGLLAWARLTSKTTVWWVP